MPLFSKAMASPQTILVVEDDSDLRRLYGRP